MLLILPLQLFCSVILVCLPSSCAQHSSGRGEGSSVDNSQCPNPTALSSPLTLWDVGFTLQRERTVADRLATADEVEDKGETIEPLDELEESKDSHGQSLDDLTFKHNGSDFVSFEEWKKLRLAEDGEAAEQDVGEIGLEAQRTTLKNTSEEPSNSVTVTTATGNEIPVQPVPEDLRESISTFDSSRRTTETFPVPSTHNRYNYASPDCSARIHSASPATQHSSSLLHKSRDRYMLTPCKASEHWVVVELCDEIRIEAIELAVWEFFSGIVREVRLSVGGVGEQEDTSTDSNEWKEIGTFIGKNVRGVQTYSLPQATSFHRFVRIDFLSFYGSEYYCPVSHLRVFGMNQMEAFKWEQKRLASSRKDKEREKERSRDVEADERRAREREERLVRETARKKEDEAKVRELNELERLVFQEARRAVVISGTLDLETGVTPQESSRDPPITSRATLEKAINLPTSRSEDITASAEELVTDPSQHALLSTSKPHTARSDSSESIYVVITRRLNALEGNSSLIARYIEEQSRLVRSALSRLEKDWEEWRHERESGDAQRWEQERMRQEDRLGRLISQMEQQRITLDLDRRSINSQLRILSEDLNHERRRGLAQMTITIILLVLGLMSQSSVIDAVLKPLVVEARRRRSVYTRDRRYGPLTGLRIDLDSNRPPAVIGQGLPTNDVPAPLSPTPRSRASAKTGLNTRRPGTPNLHRQRRQAPFVSPSFRSLSVSDPATFTTLSPKHYGHTKGSSVSSHRLARNAHLHPIEADKYRARTKHAKSENLTAGDKPDLDLKWDTDDGSTADSTADVDDELGEV